jgi:hypothetical protein
MNSVSVLQSENKLVDVTGIEPVTPCLQVSVWFEPSGRIKDG